MRTPLLAAAATLWSPKESHADLSNEVMLYEFVGSTCTPRAADASYATGRRTAFFHGGRPCASGDATKIDTGQGRSCQLNRPASLEYQTRPSGNLYPRVQSRFPCRRALLRAIA